MRLFGNALFYFLAIGVAAYAAVAYGLLPLGSLVHPEMKAVFQEHATDGFILVMSAYSAG